MIDVSWQVRKGSSWQLRPMQVKALRALREHRKGFFGIGVGGGKTLLTMLANRALEIPPEKVVALTTANLRDEADLEYEKYRRHLKVDYIPMYSYTELSRNETMLYDLKPDCIICDEVHKLKNMKSLRTRAFVHYMKDNPDTSFVPMTGTLTTTSIKDYIHLLSLACGREGSPLPDPWKKWNQVEAMSRVLDPNPQIPPDSTDYARVAYLLNKQEDETFREAFYRVLTSLPFVIISEDTEFDGPLEIRKWKPEVSMPIREAVRQVKDGILPDGEVIQDQTSIWQKKHQVSTGFYYKTIWTELHTPAYHRAKRDLDDFVQDKMAKERRKKFGLTTDRRVMAALRSGELEHESYENWKEFDEIPEPEREVRVICEEFLENCLLFCENLLTTGQSSLLWYEYEAQRDMFSELTKDRPAFTVVGLNNSPPRNISQPLVAIVSKYSHSTGLNLQDDYSINVDICPNSEIGQYEQYIGRTHRPGQKEKVVCYINQSFNHQMDAFFRAKEKARYIEETTRQTPKILLAEVIS